VLAVAVTFLEIAYQHRYVPVTAKVGDVLLMKSLERIFGHQEYIPALLGLELKNVCEICS